MVRAGSIRRWGVSNFDIDDMEELVALPGGNEVATNQVLYNLTRRGIEHDLMPWSQRHFDFPLMAYSPIEQGDLLRHPALRKIAEQLGRDAGAGRARLGVRAARHLRHPESRPAGARDGESRRVAKCS